MNAIATPAATIPTTPGTPFAGGIYAGRFFIDEQPFALIVAPKDIGELASTKLGTGKAAKLIEGATSCFDGLGNTRALAAAGSPLGKWALNLRIGEFDDWYVPSRIEALIAFAAVREAAGFERDWYWTSTQRDGFAEYAWCQSFGHGSQPSYVKGASLRARAVRRVAI